MYSHRHHHERHSRAPVSSREWANHRWRRSARPITSARYGFRVAASRTSPRVRPSRDDSTDVLVVVTLSHAAAPPRCDLVRASRTRVRQVHVTQRGPARGVRPGLRAVARADGRHASGRRGARRRGRRRHHPAGRKSGCDERTDPRADTAAFGGNARRAIYRDGRLRRNLPTLESYGRRGDEGWCDLCRATTRHKSAPPREERHLTPSRREREAKDDAARRVTR